MKKASQKRPAAVANVEPAVEAPAAEPAALQPQANPTISALLGSCTSVPESDLLPENMPGDLDLHDGDQVQEYSRVEYRRHLREAKDQTVTIMRTAGKARDRLAAIKEINDQAGLTRKIESTSDPAQQISAAILVEAFSKLRTVLGNAQVGTVMRNVSEANVMGTIPPRDTGSAELPPLPSLSLPDTVKRQNAQDRK